MIEFHAATGPRLMLDEGSVLDIGACVIGVENVAPGRAIPDDGDPRIDHSLEGFLFTCGPDHIRHPDTIAGNTDGKRYPLHGSASGHPARIRSLVMKDDSAECSADIAISCADGGSARIERQWRIDGQTGVVTLEDRLVNTGSAPMAPMLMYHMNIGARLFDEGARLEGTMLEGGGFPWAFGPGTGGVFCVPAVAAPDGWATVRLGPVAGIGGRVLSVGFRVDSLPFLQIWRNQAAPAHVLGIEPCSHRWVDRSTLEAAGELDRLPPGGTRTYGLRFSFD